MSSDDGDYKSGEEYDRAAEDARRKREQAELDQRVREHNRHQMVRSALIALSPHLVLTKSHADPEAYTMLARGAVLLADATLAMMEDVP